MAKKIQDTNLGNTVEKTVSTSVDPANVKNKNSKTPKKWSDGKYPSGLTFLKNTQYAVQ